MTSQRRLCLASLLVVLTLAACSRADEADVRSDAALLGADAGALSGVDAGAVSGADAGALPDAAAWSDGAAATDPVVEVGTGPAGMCTRTRAGRVLCNSYCMGGFEVVPSGARAISVGGTTAYHWEHLGCALLDSGQIECASSSGTRYQAGIERAVMVSVGEQVACALSSPSLHGLPEASQIHCWDPFTGPSSLTSVALPDELGQPVEVACGWAYCCARTITGAVACWGNGPNGELGFRCEPGPVSCRGSGLGGVPETSADPVQVALAAPATHIAAGYAQACALLENGPMQCWGLARDPVAFQPTCMPVRQLVSGDDVTCVLYWGGQVSCVHGDIESLPFPNPVAQIEQIYAGRGDLCAVDALGDVSCVPLPF